MVVDAQISLHGVFRPCGFSPQFADELLAEEFAPVVLDEVVGIAEVFVK